jgi:hypothetical protein
MRHRPGRRGGRFPSGRPIDPGVRYLHPQKRGEALARGGSERGEIRLRTLFETALLFLFAYALVQVGPAVLLRVKFVDQMTAAANSPVDMTADVIKRNLLDTAEGFGLTLFADDLKVVRNREQKKTFVSATYEIHINFWPSFTYVWLVKDEVEGYYF